MAEVFNAMHAYPAIVGGNGEGDSVLATVSNGASKDGARGCVGLAVRGGVAVASKSWDGLNEVADLAAASALSQVMTLTQAQLGDLEAVMAPDQFGGGQPVGKMESSFELEWI